MLARLARTRARGYMRMLRLLPVRARAPGIYHALFGVTTALTPDLAPEQLAGWQVFLDC